MADLEPQETSQETNGHAPESAPGVGEAAQLPERIRVHALAKLLGTTSKRILAHLTDMGSEARSAQSSLDRTVAESVREAFVPADEAQPAAPSPDAPQAGVVPTENAPAEAAPDEIAPVEPAGTPETVAGSQPTAAQTRPDEPAPPRRQSLFTSPFQPHRPTTPEPVSFEQPAVVAAPLFLPPDAAAAEEARRQRKAARQAKLEQERAAQAQAEQEQAQAAEERAAQQRIAADAPAQDKPARVESAGAPDESADDESAATSDWDDDQSQDSDDDNGRSRRRRRGRRGRGRGRGEQSADGEGDDSDESDDDESAESDEDAARRIRDRGRRGRGRRRAEGATRRRRRRRRRKGGEDAETEPSETIRRTPSCTCANRGTAAREHVQFRLRGAGHPRLDPAGGQAAAPPRCPRRPDARPQILDRGGVPGPPGVRRPGDGGPAARRPGARWRCSRTASWSSTSSPAPGPSRLMGNIYLGKVQNVLPSMEAAFVDIGKGRNAVLYAGEVNWDAAGSAARPVASRRRCPAATPSWCRSPRIRSVTRAPG